MVVEINYFHFLISLFVACNQELPEVEEHEFDGGSSESCSHWASLRPRWASLRRHTTHARVQTSTRAPQDRKWRVSDWRRGSWTSGQYPELTWRLHEKPESSLEQTSKSSSQFVQRQLAPESWQRPPDHWQWSRESWFLSSCSRTWSWPQSPSCSSQDGRQTQAESRCHQAQKTATTCGGKYFCNFLSKYFCYFSFDCVAGASNWGETLCHRISSNKGNVRVFLSKCQKQIQESW